MDAKEELIPLLKLAPDNTFIRCSLSDPSHLLSAETSPDGSTRRNDEIILTWGIVPPFKHQWK